MRSLGSLKAKTLQRIAFLSGSLSTGSKSSLVESLNATFSKPQIPQIGHRILSIDMGIRNLAYCVLEVPQSTMATDDVNLKQSLNVKEWRRLDLIDRLVPPSHTNLLPAEKLSAVTTRKTAFPQRAFAPSVMSKAAFEITRELLAYHPTTILIERQRFRSGSSSAILEWTVRVNMLESMLWASFETQKMMQRPSARKEFPPIHEVNPATVARFWTAGPDASLRTSQTILEEHSDKNEASSLPKRGARSVDKKEKIAVVRSWLTGEGGVSLDVQPELQGTVDAFVKKPTRARRKKGDVDDGSAQDRLTKLDDLADCLLQGAAWVRWQQNRFDLARLLAAHDFTLTEP